MGRYETTLRSVMPQELLLLLESQSTNLKYHFMCNPGISWRLFKYFCKGSLFLDQWLEPLVK